MKSLLVKSGVILIIGLAIFGNAEAWGADWKYYGSDELSMDYYDAQSITRPSENVVRVWVKSYYTKKGVMFWVSHMERFGEKFYDLNNSIILHEINCLEKKYRNPSGVFYDNKREPIHSLDGTSSEWHFFVPDTVAESLYKEVCK